MRCDLNLNQPSLRSHAYLTWVFWGGGGMGREGGNRILDGVFFRAPSRDQDRLLLHTHTRTAASILPRPGSILRLTSLCALSIDMPNFALVMPWLIHMLRTTNSNSEFVLGICQSGHYEFYILFWAFIRTGWSFSMKESCRDVCRNAFCPASEFLTTSVLI